MRNPESPELPMSAIIAPAKPKSTKKPFGAGILPTHPSYRLDCTIADLAWYEEQLAMEEERMIERMYQEFRATERMTDGLEPW